LLSIPRSPLSSRGQKNPTARITPSGHSCSRPAPAPPPTRSASGAASPTPDRSHPSVFTGGPQGRLPPVSGEFRPNAPKDVPPGVVLAPAQPVPAAPNAQVSPWTEPVSGENLATHSLANGSDADARPLQQTRSTHCHMRSARAARRPGHRSTWRIPWRQDRAVGAPTSRERVIIVSIACAHLPVFCGVNSGRNERTRLDVPACVFEDCG
jgi:hypothetical protein